MSVKIELDRDILVKAASSLAVRLPEHMGGSTCDHAHIVEPPSGPSTMWLVNCARTECGWWSELSDGDVVLRALLLRALGE